MKYLDYSAGDFANDSFFIRWVKSPDEESDWFWQSFMTEHPSCAKEIDEARRLVLEVSFPYDALGEGEMDRMRNSMLMRVKADREVERPREAFLTSAMAAWLKAAAVALIVCTVGLASYFAVRDSGSAPIAKSTAEETLLEQRSNPVGQKSVLFLSDGTKVWLNAASRISYAPDFRQTQTRDVYLEGEAFFDVTHNPDKPFVVHTSSIQVKVLGTSFNVKSYSEEKTIETTLVEGSVRIEQSDEAGRQLGVVELKPNQRAVFDKASRVINVREIFAAGSGSWKEDRLVFDEEPIDNVILQMERWFNVKIHAADRGHLDCKMTASIDNESLQDVLKLIEATHGVKCIVSGMDVFIEGKLCN